MTRFGALVVVLMVGLYELSELGIWNVYSDPGLIVLPAFAEWLAPRLRSVSPNVNRILLPITLHASYIRWQQVNCCG